MRPAFAGVGPCQDLSHLVPRLRSKLDRARANEFEPYALIERSELLVRDQEHSIICPHGAYPGYILAQHGRGDALPAMRRGDVDGVHAHR